MIRAFVPELKSIHISRQSATFLTTEGVQGTVVTLPVLDLEDREIGEKISHLGSLLEDLTPGDLLRICYKADAYRGPTGTSREKTVLEVGALSQSLLISYEKYPTFWDTIRSFTHKKAFELSPSVLSASAMGGLEAVPVTESALSNLFDLPLNEVCSAKDAIDFGDSVLGCVRLWKQGSTPITEETLAIMKDELPVPYEIHVSMRKQKSSTTEFSLRSKLAQETLSKNPTSGAKARSLATDLENLTLHGSSILEMEWILLIRRASNEELRRDLEQIARALRPLGDVMIETVGLVKTYKATRIGHRQHHTFNESIENAMAYLPVFAFGATPAIPRSSKRCLLLHRQDGSLHFFDQFNSKFLAFNVVIAGKTGSGKSVLANALTSSLLQDPNVEMVKIDVGGSYTKECELFSGKEFTFSLSRPTGINPFRSLSLLESAHEALEILSKFLCTLIREEDELTVPRSIQTEVDKLLKEYAATNPRFPSISDFFDRTQPFSRKELLSRWVRGGIYENALTDTEGEGAANRYRYYNFESLQSASSPEFAEGVMAAVIAATNLEMIEMAKNRPDARLVLVCDETKFFIERNAAFFLLTTANFRKFGHGVILITQKVQNFDLPTANGKTNSGILLNSPIRFLFEQDVEEPYLQSTFHLEESHLFAITRHPYRGKEFRQCVLQDDTGTRIVRLYLSPSEYWTVTSTKEDNDKIRALKELIPTLNLREVIQCISTFDARLPL